MLQNMFFEVLISAKLLKTLYLIKIVTAFPFFKISVSSGPIGTGGFAPSPPRRASCSYSNLRSLPSPQLRGSSHYHAALLIFLSYQLANHKPLSLMAWFWVHSYSFCRSTQPLSLLNHLKIVSPLPWPAPLALLSSCERSMMSSHSLSLSLTKRLFYLKEGATEREGA